MSAKADRRRRGGPRALAATLPAITRPLFGKRGFANGAILTDWPSIAGELLARHSLPERITYPAGARSGGTLHLRIDSGGMATELQHLEPVLIERINGFFGFKAIGRLKIIQGPLPAPADKPASGAGRPLDEAEEKDLAHSLADVEDEDLHRALSALGRAMAGRRKG